MSRTAKLELDGKSYELPIVEGTEKELAIDISSLRAQTGYITLDDGYGNTGSCSSAITFIDGDKGILRYRGIPIEEIAGKSSFVETAWLVMFGHLPTVDDRERFSKLLTENSRLDESMRKHFEGFPPNGHPMAILSAMINALSTLLLAVFAPLIAPYDAESFYDYDRLNSPPSAAHWLGVDPLGRDILSRILMGSRISLAAGLFSVVLGGLVGTTLGLLAGYYEGWWDRIVMRISDVLFAFPGILLALGVVAILGSSMVNVVVAVSVFSVPAFARLVRGNTLSIKNMTYVEAARSIGASNWTIVVRHILPGTISSIVVYFTMRLGTSIITAASLSFLGMGAQPPTPEWGAMLNEARADMVNAPHVALFPSLAIFLTVLAFNLLGDGLRDALDPKIDRQ